MKKLIKLAIAGAAAALLFSPLSYAQEPGTTTITVEKVGPSSSGYKVCYRPEQRKVEGSRIVQRCGGGMGCQNFKVTREFYVTVYSDCHLEKYSCPSNYKTFGRYPNKSEARDAVDRCSHTISGNVPQEWRVTSY